MIQITRLNHVSLLVADTRRALDFYHGILGLPISTLRPNLGFPGAYREGVTTVRTVEDADQILDMGVSGMRCVCIGGGLLGLETAAALARRGAHVTLLEGHGWLLPRQLNATVGRLLAEVVRQAGIELRSKARTKEILGDVMCFWSNVPAGMLVTGKPEQIKDYIKELIDTFATPEV